MFKAQRVGSNKDEIHAVLTPSTKGMRQALLANDISFTMPLMQTQVNPNDSNTSMELGDKSDINALINEESESANLKKKPVKKAAKDQNSSNDANEDEHDENDEDDEEENENDCVGDEPDEWLEQMGLNSAVNFKASILKRNSKNQKKDSLLNFDNRPRSTLLFMEGGDVQALFNFLLNSKTCISNSGPLTGYFI